MKDSSGSYQSSKNMTSQGLANKGSLEWWQMPFKFKRQRIDQDECDVINVSINEINILSYFVIENPLNCSSNMTFYILNLSRLK